MKQLQRQLTIKTPGRGLYELTPQIEHILEESGVDTGLCVVYCCHTSASLLIQENADPTVKQDILAWLQKVAIDGDPLYKHNTEGPDDMAAHLRTMITRTSETIPVSRNKLVLGTWQGIYLAEHRSAPHHRKLIIHLTGE